MKRFFYILFLSTSIFFSFGFRGCDYVICDLILELTDAVYGLSSGQEEYDVIGADGTVRHCLDIECACGVSILSTQRLNSIGNRGIGNGDKNTQGGLITIIVGDSGTVIYSEDGGKTGEDRSIPGLTKNLYDFDFLPVGSNVPVIVCGEQGTIYKSTSSGSGWNWEPVNTITTRNLKSIIAITNDFIVAVGDSGTIIRTSDGGQTWENKSVAQNVHFNKIFNGGNSSAFGKAWAVADDGKIYYSGNYGSSWIPQFSGVIENLYDVTFRSEFEGIVVGANGVVRYTTNGGSNWLEDPYFSGLTSNDIVSIAVKDQNTASALIRNTTADGIITTTVLTVSSEPLDVDDNNNTIPTNYSLVQNYPNPFNPNTVIGYQLPESGVVSLKVFDILGNEVANLVDEYKPAGNYEVNFNAEALVSGIYFYELQAGSFIETKKMILIK